jgi:hypothetical protein
MRRRHAGSSKGERLTAARLGGGGMVDSTRDAAKPIAVEHTADIHAAAGGATVKRVDRGFAMIQRKSITNSHRFWPAVKLHHGKQSQASIVQSGLQ